MNIPDGMHEQFEQAGIRCTLTDGDQTAKPS